MRQVSNLLEVIVTSLHEAIEAERGGADRLELVRALDEEGLTPSWDLVRNVLHAVTIPVRVILRNKPGFAPPTDEEIQEMRERAGLLSGLPIDGLVLGFIKDGRIDIESLQKILAVAPQHRVTFHRAFDYIDDPFSALKQLTQVPQVDRILTSGGEGTWAERKTRLRSWQEAVGDRIKIIVGGGLDGHGLACLAQDPLLTEFHVGRAVRIPASSIGAVRRARVSALKSLFS